jgi:hypothetical protein
MEIRCRCQSCAAKFKVDAKFAGKKARCPKCQTVVEVPLTSLEESTIMLQPGQPGQPSQPQAAPSLAPAPSASSSAILTPRPNVPVAPLITPGRPQMPGVANLPPAPMPQLPPLPGSAPMPQVAPQPAAMQQPAPSPQHPTPAAPLVNPAPGAAPQPSEAASAPFVPLVSPRSASPAGTTGESRPTYGKKKSNPLPLILGGGAAVLLIVGLGVVALLTMGGGPTPVANKVKGGGAGTLGSGTLYLDWPSDQRRGGALTIDGGKRPLSASGQLKFVLTAGSHQIYLQRRGYEPIEATIDLAKGETEHYVPAWKSSGLAPPISEVATSGFTPPKPTTPNSGTPSSTPGSGFPIGTAIPTIAPKGFDGWLQLLDTAKRQAQQGQLKDILIVFGCSDAQRSTQELAKQLEQAGVKNNYVCLVIDYPRTAEGYNLLEDRGQNQQLQEDFSLEKLPAVALADEQGRTYFMKRTWEDGFANLQERLTKWKADRTERDSLLASVSAATDEPQLAAAAKVVKWLQDKTVWPFYRSEIVGWHALAKRIDPNNEKALQETFFEPEWFLDVVQINREDGGAISRVTGQLDPWIGRGGFKDQDRGAKLHMTAAMLLAQVEKFDDATKQLEQAVKYQPKDSKLADALANLKTRLENKDVLGSGTGFLVSSAGYVLTNNHVIEGEGRVEIRLPGTKDTVPAQVVATDEDRDMALLKVTFPDPAKFNPVAVGTEEIGRGSEVAAFGFPLGDQLGTGLKFTRGSISGLPDPSNDDMYLLDLRVNPGNSGGPLCDGRGYVVGMITKKTGNFGFEDSYGMAIPSATLLEFLGQHLPADAPRVAADPAAAPLGWDQVDKRVSSGVLMILKKK